MLNKYKILTSLLIIISLLSYGQSNDDNRTPFDKAVDYCNCKVVIAYTKSFVEKNPDKPKENEGYNVLIKNTNGCDKDNPIKFLKLSELLNKNSFENCNQNISNKMFKLLTEKKNILKDSSSQHIIEQIMGCVYLKTQYSIFDNYKDYPTEINNIRNDLQKDLKYILESNKQIEKISAQNENTQLTNLKQQAEEQKNNQQIKSDTIEEKLVFSSVQMTFAFIIVLLLIIAIYILNKSEISSNFDSIRRHRDEIENLKNQNNNFSPKPTFDNQLDKKVRELENTITQLTFKLSSLEEKMTKSFTENISLNNNVKNNSIVEEYDVKKQSEITETVFYLSAPSNEGIFSNPLNKPNSDIFYKLIISSSNSSTATFEFFNSESAIREAVSFPEIVLNIACESLNSVNRKSKSIKTVDRGMLVKQNDKWVIKDKAKIRYE